MTSLDIEYLKNNIQLILNKTHSNPQKLKIVQKHDRLSFACPICGDSHKDNYQKRGHLFFNNLYYKCYNEDCKSTFTKLCKTYDIQLDPNKKLELINYIDTNFSKYQQNNDDIITTKLDKLIPFKDLTDWFDSGKGPLKAFKPVQYGSHVYNYLINRGIPKELIINFYEGIQYNGKFSTPFVVFINKMKDNVIGMQIRNLENNKFRKFKIFTFKELYDSIYNTELDIIESIAYNKFSYLFNILSVNFEATITIFEGYLDSLFFPNSIGAVGINTDYSFLLNSDTNLRFFFDNDNTGKKKSIEYIKKGRTVFLWEKLITDLSKKEENPYEFIIWFNNTIKDLNALMKYKPIHWKTLEKYFSNNKFDSFYINPIYSKPIKENNLFRNWDIDIKELKKS